jgi:acyl carrier protein
MELNDFISNVADQFGHTDKSQFIPQAKFRDLQEWDSLTALLVMAMIDEEYHVTLEADEVRNSNTIQELYDVVKSRL